MINKIVQFFLLLLLIQPIVAQDNKDATKNLDPGNAKQVVINVRGASITYNVAMQSLSVDGVTAKAPLIKVKISLNIYADRIGLEIFADNGLFFYAC